MLVSFYLFYMSYYIGIDVGTGSARCAIVDQNGMVVSKAKCEIELWNPLPQYYEQSSQNIWEAVCWATREAVRLSGLVQLFLNL